MDTLPSLEDLPPDDLDRLNAACARFEAALRADERVGLEPFLTGCPPELERHLFRELLWLECDRHTEAGRGWGRDALLARFPDRLPDIDWVLTAAGDAGRLPPQIGPYRVMGLLGSGGFGVVYRAVDPTDGGPVAVKVPHPQHRSSAAARNRFSAEARLLGGLSHPNLARLVGWAADHDECFLATELVDGPSLAVAVRAAPDPDWRTAAGLVWDVARGVAHAHAAGVIHLDLKPANVLIGPDGRPRVVDFGLARVAAAVGGPTGTGQVLGTPGYMAPEQFDLGRPELTPAVDVFALGATLYELLTGRPPFVGVTPVATIVLTLTTDPPPLPGHLPRGLRAACLCCLEVDPTRRYPTAVEFGDDLGRVLAGLPPHARMPSAARRVWRAARRRPVRSALLGAGLAVAVLLVISGVREHRLNGALSASLDALRDERARLVDREARLGHLAYAAGVRLATDLHARGERAAARAELDRWLPAPDRPDLRGCEWRLLDRLCSPDRRVSRWAVSGRVVYGTDLGPDGRGLVVAAADGVVRRIDAADGSPLGPPLAHPAEVGQAVFDPAGGRVATACDDGRVRVWGLDGRLEHDLPTHHGRVASVAFADDGAAVYSAGRDDGRLVRWDLAADPPVSRTLYADPAGLLAAALLPGRRAVAVGGRAGQLLVVDGSDGRVLDRLTDRGAAVRVVRAVSGDRLLTAVLTNDVTDWRRQPEGGWSRERVDIGGDRGRVYDVAADRSGRPLVSAASGVYAVRPGAVLRLGPAGPTPRPIWGLTAGPADRLYAATAEGVVEVWDLTEGSPAERLSGAGRVRLVATRPDGSIVVSTRNPDLVARWRPAAGGRPAESLGTSAGVFVVTAADPPGGDGWLAATNDARLVRLDEGGNWRLGGGPGDQTGRSADDPGAGVALSPAGRRLAVAAADGTARVWELGRSVTGPITLDRGTPLTLLTFLSDDRLAGWDGGGRLSVWDLAAGTADRYPAVGSVHAARVSPDGRRLVAVDGDGAVWQYDLADRAVAARTPATGAACVCFAPDGRTVITGGTDGTVRFWQAGTWAELWQVKLPPNVRAVWFGPDGSSLWALTNSESGGRPFYQVFELGR